MKETKTLQHIHSLVEQFARKLLKESGYEIQPDMPDKTGDRGCDDLPGEQGLAVTMNVVGYSRRYDGWEYELTPRDWKDILSINWDNDDLKLLNYVKKMGNKNLTFDEIVAETGLELSLWHGFRDGNWINKQFIRNRLPYHVGLTHKQPSNKNGYPSMMRIFKRPIPIDQEE